MKKLLCSLLMVIPLVGLGKALDSIVKIDGALHVVAPQNTVTYEVDTHGNLILPFNCWITQRVSSDIGAPFRIMVSNYVPDGGFDGDSIGVVENAPITFRFKGKEKTQKIQQAFFHFMNEDMERSFMVTCLYV